MPMPLWKISARNNWNFGKDMVLTKGMYIELSTPTTTPPLGQTQLQETIAKAFNTKYSTKFEKSKMNSSHLVCERVG